MTKATKAVVRVDGGAALGGQRIRRQDVLALCSQSLDSLEELLGPSRIREISAKCLGHPVLALVEAVKELRDKYPLGSRWLEDEVREAVRTRVAGYLFEHPELSPVRPVLFGKLYAGLLHRFEAERTHLAPRISRERILEYVRTFPLPGPETLPAFAWLLLRVRARLGLTQQALAQRLGVSRRAYAAWESGRRGLLPSQEECLREELARLLAGPICLSKA